MRAAAINYDDAIFVVDAPWRVQHCGFMDIEAFIAKATSIYGRSGWQVQLASDLSVSTGTVCRWKRGVHPIPSWVPVAMDGIKARREASK